jgi:hypothetical protein
LLAMLRGRWSQFVRQAVPVSPHGRPGAGAAHRGRSRIDNGSQGTMGSLDEGTDAYNKHRPDAGSGLATAIALPRCFRTRWE